MTSRPRQLLRRVASKWIGERAIPVGGVASDRRLLRRVLEGRSVGRVLVIGRSLAARQALAPMQIDVAGTSPYATGSLSARQSTGSIHCRGLGGTRSSSRMPVEI